MQTLQSQDHDSVENEETHKETQGHSKHESREATAPGLDAPEAWMPQKLLQKKFSPCPYGNPLRTNHLMNVLQTSGNCIHTACSQTQPLKSELALN